MMLEEPANHPKQSRASRSGLRLMIVITLGIVAVAIYSNIQKLRRDKIETVTITPVSTATPLPSVAPRK